MVLQTILQSEIATNFIYPFTLVWFLLFAILEKTKIFTTGKQVNAIISLVVSLIFVSVAYPKMVVSNMMLFLTVAIVIVFVALILWGFVSGGSLEKDFVTGKAKWVVLGVVLVAVFFAVLWATGSDSMLYNFLFNQSWSSALWTNVAFIVVIGVALAVILRGGAKSG